MKRSRLTNPAITRANVNIATLAILTLALVAIATPACGQSMPSYHRTVAIAANEPVVLDVDVPKGELQILYSREGQVSVSASLQSSAKATVIENLESSISLEQDGNHLKLTYAPNSPNSDAGIFYRLDVPYRTTVVATIHDGKLTVSGVMGPVKATTGRGDITISYISKEVVAEAGSGDLDLQVIGAQVEARTGHGNISCTRAPQGVSAETQDGDITLMVVGPSTANVKAGSGRINVGGARGSLLGTTDAGELHVKAVPQSDWQLRSRAGNVKVEMPPNAKYELDAASNSGSISSERDDIQHPADAHRLRQAVNGGGPRIDVHTDSGGIVIR